MKPQTQNKIMASAIVIAFILLISLMFYLRLRYDVYVRKEGMRQAIEESKKK